jgi:hypothetical protein
MSFISMIPGPVCDFVSDSLRPGFFVFRGALELSFVFSLLRFSASKGSVNIAVFEGPLLSAVWTGSWVVRLETELCNSVSRVRCWPTGEGTAPSAIMMGETGPAWKAAEVSVAGLSASGFVKLRMAGSTKAGGGRTWGIGREACCSSRVVATGVTRSSSFLPPGCVGVTSRSTKYHFEGTISGSRHLPRRPEPVRLEDFAE